MNTVLKSAAAAMMLMAAFAASTKGAQAQAQRFDPEMPVMCNMPAPSFNEKFRRAEPGIVQKSMEAYQRQQDANKEFCDKERKALEDRREKNRQVQEANRIEGERLAKQRAQEQQAAAERARLQEIEMAKPVNQLRLAYYRYAYIRACYKIRLGYLAVWINEVELQRAKDTVTRREATLLGQDQTIDTAAEWSLVQAKMPQWYYEHECRRHYNDLLASVPAMPQKKDFGS
jgi:hypothetical protein